jgi:hypothetical protein
LKEYIKFAGEKEEVHFQMARQAGVEGALSLVRHSGLDQGKFNPDLATISL